MTNEIEELGDDDRTNALLRGLGQFRRIERLVVLCMALLLVVFAVLDGIEDFWEGQEWHAQIVDFIYALFSLTIFLYLYRLTPLSLKSRDAILTNAIIAQHKDTESWRGKASELLQGLGRVIEEQCNEWQLSTAEKEVALLLLKGLSLKEIAALRETAERTVRQQASTVYAKAGISGRAELSAFFLEDLLLPNSS